uniref:Uncharacterized protein n=1 Tax=Triticum urartu TaxID=4572 RepID=A0A8R7QV05_TRIUA
MSREWSCLLAAMPEGAVRPVASLMPTKSARAPRACAASEVHSSLHAVQAVVWSWSNVAEASVLPA